MHEVVSGATTKGKVFLDKQDIYDRDVDPVRVRGRVGMVFQKPNPFPTMSIRDNVLAGLRLNGIFAERSRRPSGEGAAPGGRVGRGQGSHGQGWHESLRRSASQRLCNRSGSGARARGSADGRALFGARSHPTARVEELIHELRSNTRS